MGEDREDRRAEGREMTGRRERSVEEGGVYGSREWS